MSDALGEHDGKVSIGGRNITNLRFADDTDALAEEEQELEALIESLDKTCTRYKMEISAEKTKLMTNNANGIQREIKVKGQKLGTVTSFKYLVEVVSDDSSKPEVLSRIAQVTAAPTKLKPIWRDNNISLGSKVKLMRSRVISIFLYACESWPLTAELEKRTQAIEMRCYRRLLNISYKAHVTNEEVCRKIQAAIGEYDEFLTLVKKRKLRWFGHVSRSSGLAKTILQGTVKGKRTRDRQKKRWEDNIKEWTGMDFASSTRAAENRTRWKGIVANSSVVPRRPSCVFQFSNDVPRVAQRYGTIAAHTRRRASVLVVFVVFCVYMYSFVGLIRRTPPPTFSDTAITDRHSDTTNFQLRAHWVWISWSIGSEKAFGHVPPVGVEPSTSCVQGAPLPDELPRLWDRIE